MQHYIVMIVRWCNGNTADFGSAFPGSSPGRVNQFQPGKTGSALRPLKTCSDQLQVFLFGEPGGTLLMRSAS